MFRRKKSPPTAETANPFEDDALQDEIRSLKEQQAQLIHTLATTREETQKTRDQAAELKTRIAALRPEVERKRKRLETFDEDVAKAARARAHALLAKLGHEPIDHDIDR